MKQFTKFAATAGVAGAILAAPFAAAQAAPADHVPGTNCNVGQVERATVAVAPEAATLINQVPGGRAEAQRILALPEQARIARVYELGAQNPQLSSYYFANQGRINQTISQVVATCAQY